MVAGEIFFEKGCASAMKKINGGRNHGQGIGAKIPLRQIFCKASGFSFEAGVFILIPDA